MQEGAGEHRACCGKRSGQAGAVLRAGGFRDQSGKVGWDQPLEGLAGKAEGLTSSPGNEQPKPNMDLQPRPPATWQLSHVQEAPA